MYVCMYVYIYVCIYNTYSTSQSTIWENILREPKASENVA